MISYPCKPYSGANYSRDNREHTGELTAAQVEELLDYLYSRDAFVQGGPGQTPSGRIGQVRLVCVPASFLRYFPPDEIDAILAGAPHVGETIRKGQEEARRAPRFRFTQLSVSGLYVGMTREKAEQAGKRLGPATTEISAECPDFGRCVWGGSSKAAFVWGVDGRVWSCSGTELMVDGKPLLAAGAHEPAVVQELGPPDRKDGAGPGNWTSFYHWSTSSSRYQTLAVTFEGGKVTLFCLSDSAWVRERGGSWDLRSAVLPTGVPADW